MELMNSEPWTSQGEDGEVKKQPPWVEAVEVFVSAGFKPGEVVSHNWFYDAFGLLQPTQCPSISAAQQSQLRYLSNMEALKSALLQEHQIALRSARGVGYEVVPPQEQTAWAMTEVRGELRRAMRAGATRLAFVQVDALNEDQKKENLDARAKLSFFRKESRKTLAM